MTPKGFGLAGSEDAPKQAAPCSEKSDAKISRRGAECALGHLDRVRLTPTTSPTMLLHTLLIRKAHRHFEVPCDWQKRFLRQT